MRLVCLSPSVTNHCSRRVALYLGLEFLSTFYAQRLNSLNELSLRGHWQLDAKSQGAFAVRRNSSHGCANLMETHVQLRTLDAIQFIMVLYGKI
jgi:hypothetical protein